MVLETDFPMNKKLVERFNGNVSKLRHKTMQFNVEHCFADNFTQLKFQSQLEF